MAKPIRATPTLKGEEAVQFLNRMKEVESRKTLSSIDKKWLALYRRNKKFFD